MEQVDYIQLVSLLNEFKRIDRKKVLLSIDGISFETYNTHYMGTFLSSAKGDIIQIVLTVGL